MRRHVLVISRNEQIGRWFRFAIGGLRTGLPTTVATDLDKGLLAMKRAGAWTIAQDQASCVVYGMPREAVALGAADEVAPLGEIGARLAARLRGARVPIT